VALLGLFALSSLLIEQKLKDVAIKKTLGASEKSIVLDLTKKFLIISAFAVLISIPISYYFMNEWLKDFAYQNRDALVSVCVKFCDFTAFNFRCCEH
jgi:putative ABC transport system permease protein